MEIEAGPLKKKDLGLWRGWVILQREVAGGQSFFSPLAHVDTNTCMVWGSDSAF